MNITGKVNLLLENMASAHNGIIAKACALGANIKAALNMACIHAFKPFGIEHKLFKGKVLIIHALVNNLVGRAFYQGHTFKLLIKIVGAELKHQLLPRA